MTKLTDPPNECPEDLRQDLLGLERARYTKRPSDYYGVFRDWMMKHGVKTPEGLPRRPEIDGRRDQ